MKKRKKNKNKKYLLIVVVGILSIVITYFLLISNTFLDNLKGITASIFNTKENSSKIVESAEIKDLKNLHRLQEQHPYLKDCMILSDSDAHYLPDIHEPTYTMLVPELSVRGVFAALKAAATRK